MAELYSTLGGALAPRPRCRHYRAVSRSGNREHSLGSRSAAGRSGKDSPCLQVSLDPRKSSECICFGHSNWEVFVRLRDVNLSMAFPGDQATEVIIHLQPHLIATSGSTLASYATVVIVTSNDAVASRLVGANMGFQIVSSITDGKSLALYSHKEL